MKRPELRLVVGVVTGAGAIAAVALLLASGEPPTTTPAASLPTTSTTAASTTLPPTSAPSTTAPPTTTAVIPSEAFDVVVVGDSLGGVSAAVTAGQLGARTLLLSPVGYLGGQASAGGVSTFDEGRAPELLRLGGLYRELLRHFEEVYGTRTPGQCYFSTDTVCPEPNVVHQFFLSKLQEAGVEVRALREVEAVLQSGERVTGVVADDLPYAAHVVIDATELQELYPLVEGLEFAVGNQSGCVQDLTWTAVRSWYPDGVPEELVPPFEGILDLRDHYGTEQVQAWLDHFRSLVAGEPATDVTLNTWPTSGLPWNPTVELGYRAMADRRPEAAGEGALAVTRSGVNFANDSPLVPGAFNDPGELETAFRQALHVTYAYLWYLHWELGMEEWGISNDLGYPQANRWLWDPLVPDGLEQHLPPQPYIREGRRLRALFELQGEDVATGARRETRFWDSVMLGHYFTDSHGCPLPEAPSGDGLYEVPLGVFIPERVDGFLPGMVRAAGVDATAASSLRMQLDEIWSGQVVGYLAATAAQRGVQPREIGYRDVQRYIQEIGYSVKVPPLYE